MFSDQQLVTSIGILVGGYSQISSALSKYHSHIVVHLAWFSSPTHLTTLTVRRVPSAVSLPWYTGETLFICCTIVPLGAALAPTDCVREAVNNPGEPSVSPAISCVFSTAKIQRSTYSDSLHAFKRLFISVSLLFLLASRRSRAISLFTLTANKV